MTAAHGKFARDFERRFDALVAGGLRPAEAAAWVRLARPVAALRKIEQWRHLTGLGPLDAWEWESTGITPSKAAPWIANGWTYDQYKVFHHVRGEAAQAAEQAGKPGPGEPLDWLKSHIPPDRCIDYLRLRITLDQATAIEARHANEGSDPGEAVALLLALLQRNGG